MKFDESHVIRSLLSYIARQQPGVPADAPAHVDPLLVWRWAADMLARRIKAGQDRGGRVSRVRDLCLRAAEGEMPSAAEWGTVLADGIRPCQLDLQGNWAMSAAWEVARAGSLLVAGGWEQQPSSGLLHGFGADWLASAARAAFEASGRDSAETRSQAADLAALLGRGEQR